MYLDTHVFCSGIFYGKFVCVSSSINQFKHVFYVLDEFRNILMVSLCVLMFCTFKDR